MFFSPESFSDETYFDIVYPFNTAKKKCTSTQSLAEASNLQNAVFAGSQINVLHSSQTFLFFY